MAGPRQVDRVRDIQTLIEPATRVFYSSVILFSNVCILVDRRWPSLFYNIGRRRRVSDCGIDDGGKNNLKDPDESPGFAGHCEVLIQKSMRSPNSSRRPE